MIEPHVCNHNCAASGSGAAACAAEVVARWTRLAPEAAGVERTADRLLQGFRSPAKCRSDALRMRSRCSALALSLYSFGTPVRVGTLKFLGSSVHLRKKRLSSDWSPIESSHALLRDAVTFGGIVMALCGYDGAQ